MIVIEDDQNKIVNGIIIVLEKENYWTRPNRKYKPLQSTVFEIQAVMQRTMMTQ